MPRPYMNGLTSSVCNFYMTAAVDIISRGDIRINACCRSQPNKSKLALYKPLLYIKYLSVGPYVRNTIISKCYTNLRRMHRSYVAPMYM